MRHDLRPALAFTLLLVPALAAGAAQDRPAPPGPDEARTIELHVGVPGLAFIGQRLEDLLKRFPDAQVVPFAGQEDAVTVKVPGAGISFIAVGAPGDLKVASAGFNLEGAYEGMAEGDFRTSKGIGKNSTVNDLLEAYGPPVDLLSEHPRGSPRRAVPKDDPSLPQKYQYANEGGTVKTYFTVENHRVTRIVVNDLAPLDEHIVKAGSRK